VQALMPTDLCSEVNVADSSLAMEAKEQTDGYSNKSLVPESPNSPNSNIDSNEAKKSIEEDYSIRIQEACALKQTEVTQFDETDCDEHICVVCGSAETPGILKSCDGNGCKRKFHISCLGFPLECFSLGIWLCSICSKERLLSGVYTASGGVESLWDVKEGVQNCKQYFVKYKNLAHVHNRWTPESDIGHDLVSKFSKKNKKEKTIMWRQEWAEPHRLLMKRSLMPPKEAEEFFHSTGDKLAFCNVEWLVKWKDLGYEHATWELDTSSFLCTGEAEELKRNYENRHEAARKTSDTAKIKKAKQSPFQKLRRLPDGCPPGLDNVHLSSLNQLCEFWHNSRGAILVDDQERIIKTVLFAMSILPDVSCPLLIVSTSVSLWEAKFNLLAPYINVVVYNGEKDVRKTIRDLEFYDNGSMMLQVLLAHPDAILEDIETMKCIVWEAVIVDDCQISRVSKCLEQLKHLLADFRMVLLSSPLKENIVDYINLLSFVNSEGNDMSSISNVNSIDTPGTIAMLKSKLALHLEIYCYTLHSNSSALRSHSKTDSVGALRDMLLSLRKCCDHPYLADQMLQASLTKDRPATDILDIGVHASGKLLLLDKMLQEIRGKGMRVVILSHPGAGAGNPMGDILDDFVRQRFGFESYERVERNLPAQKKHIAMSMFNDKTKGRFIFLIDSRACLSSIKLSSVDAIIIYCSDWNPANDLRILQRISIESQSERVPIFRLYSSCTVEEKALILAKHDHVLDSNIQNITPILSHSLLSWGASFLFTRLEELKNNTYSSKDSDAEKLFMDDVLLESLTKLSTKVDTSTKVSNAAISQADLSGTFYSRDIVLSGEREGISALDGDLPKFWTFWFNLLNGKFPRWQYITEPAHRCRRKIQNMEEQGKVPANETDEASTKRRKIAEIVDPSPNVLAGKDKINQISVGDTWQELGVENQHGTQKGLHVQLRPELSKLHKLLELPSVKCLCEEFLEYILKNHQVTQEPKGILHAFNIALCWRAASLLKHKVNRRESLVLAAKHLNYECSEDLASYVYDKLRILKKKFSHRAGGTSKHNQSTSVMNIPPYQEEISPKSGYDEPTVATVEGNLENGSHQEDTHDLLIEAIVPGEKEMLFVPEAHKNQHLSKDVLLGRITEKRIHLVNMVFTLREKNIRETQANEVAMLDMHRHNRVIKLREACKIVVEHLRKSHADPGRDCQIKLIIEWFTMLLYAYLEHIRYQHEKLYLLQSSVWTKELQLKENFLQEAKFGQLGGTFDQHIPLPDSGFSMEEFSHFSCCVDTFTLANCSQSLDDISAMEITLVRSVIPSEVTNAEVARNGSAEVLIHTEGRPASEGSGLTENRIQSNSDVIDSQGGASLTVQHQFSSSSVFHNSINQPLLGGTNQQIGGAGMEVNTSNGDSTLADTPHIEPPQTMAPTLQSETQPSSSREIETQANLIIQSAQPSMTPAQLPRREAEQAGLSHVASAPCMPTGMQPSTEVSNILLERTRPDLSEPSHRPEVAPGSVQSAQLFPVASMMFSHPPVGDEPLKNEVHRLRLYIDSLNKTHELKQSQLQTECNQEMEKVQQKYDLLLQEEDSTHLQQKKTLDDLCEKVLLNQSLADDFRAKFISSSGAQARAHSPPIGQAPQASQQILTRPGVTLTAPPIVSSSPGRSPLQVDRPSSLLQVSRTSSPSSHTVRPGPSIPANLVRSASAPFSQTPAALRGSYGVQVRQSPSHALSQGNPSLSSSLSSFNTSSSIVSSVASNVLPSGCVGPSVSGTRQSDSDSVSLDKWLNKNLGLSSEPPGATAGTDLVCLSDDDE
ncbi:hypothetical protein BRADI_3g06450v3, partial [Brachypodium distachyon]